MRKLTNAEAIVDEFNGGFLRNTLIGLFLALAFSILAVWFR